jgi:hypothetical protein
MAPKRACPRAEMHRFVPLLKVAELIKYAHWRMYATIFSNFIFHLAFARAAKRSTIERKRSRFVRHRSIET